MIIGVQNNVILKPDKMKTIRQSVYAFGLLALTLAVSGFNSEMQKNISVTTNKVTNIKSTTASCTITVTGSPVSEMGVCCWIKTNPTINQKKFTLPAGSRTGTPVYMTGLSPDTKYYVRSYVKSGTDIIYGNEETFTTAAPEKTNSNYGQKKEDKQTSTKK